MTPTWSKSDELHHRFNALISYVTSAANYKRRALEGPPEGRARAKGIARSQILDGRKEIDALHLAFESWAKELEEAIR